MRRLSVALFATIYLAVLSGCHGWLVKSFIITFYEHILQFETVTDFANLCGFAPLREVSKA
jgi:hypothetical protein